MDREIDVEAFKLRLLAARQALLELAETRRQSSTTVELDQSRTGRLSRMDAMQLQAMAQAGEQRAALRRVEESRDGRFGHSRTDVSSSPRRRYRVRRAMPSRAAARRLLPPSRSNT